jgi:hypothetical protein
MSNLTYKQRLRQRAARAEHNGNPFVWGKRFKNYIDANDYGYAKSHGLKRKYWGGAW